MMIHDLTEKQIRDITPTLRPGQSSREGFLNETESLIEVHDADYDTLHGLRITPEQIADKLERITAKAHRMGTLAHRRGENYWERVRKSFLVEDLYVSWDSYRGWQSCPFGCEDREAQADTDYTVTNKLGESIFFSELHIHLLRRHHFFEGHTKYRLDPKKTVRVLDIKIGEVYTPQYKTESIWRVGSGKSSSYMTVDQYKWEIFNSNYSSDQEKKVALNKGHRIDIPNVDEAYLYRDTILALHKGRQVQPEIMIDGSLLPGGELSCECVILHRKDNKYVQP